ncbi:MAG: CDP-alcohol phosphatidyltransferase family protein [Planctomycetota bacterium]|nr:CDP-alcohol phosphatidyltransferase family protein [Planctomycetota bacterium]
MELRRGSLFANLLTIGNGVCGFAALVKLSQLQLAEDNSLANPENLVFAGYLILLGMLFDAFDGKVARMVKGSTELGAQLDSLCDLITFGLVPAFMIFQMQLGASPRWMNVVWFFSLAYFLGALLRLARFNVENSPEEEAHLCFKGLPSPAAAGCVASLVIFQNYVLKAEQAELKWISENLFSIESMKTFVTAISYILPFLGVFLGFTMVSSRLKFEHVGSRIFGRSHSWEFFVSLIFAALLLAIVPEVFLPLAFIGYLVWTPVMFLFRLVFSGRGSSQADDEEPQVLQRS